VVSRHPGEPRNQHPGGSAHRADWSRATSLTDTEFLACWWELGLGEPPVGLELEYSRLPGTTPTERRHELYRAVDVVRRSGILNDQHGRRSTLATALSTLSRPGWTLDLRISDRSTTLLALGAAAPTSPDAVVVVRREHHLEVLTTRAAQLATTMIELAGPLTPGQARPVNIPAELIDRARQRATGPGPWLLADQLIGLGVDRTDAHSLARMYLDITSAGQFGATGYRPPTRRRAPWVVAFHHATLGDFVQLRRTATRGRPETLTVAPVTTDRLLAHLNEMIAALPIADAA
jgi:hypothetical protein